MQDKITLDLDAFKALSSEARISILKNLDSGKKTVTELARELDLSKAAVHEHLQKLLEAGLVKKEDGEESLKVSKPLPLEMPKAGTKRKWTYYSLTWKGRRILHPEEVKVAILLGTFVFISLFLLLSIAQPLIFVSHPSSNGTGPLAEPAPAWQTPDYSTETSTGIFGREEKAGELLLSVEFPVVPANATSYSFTMEAFLFNSTMQGHPLFAGIEGLNDAESLMNYCRLNAEYRIPLQVSAVPYEPDKTSNTSTNGSGSTSTGTSGNGSLSGSSVSNEAYPFIMVYSSLGFEWKRISGGYVLFHLTAFSHKGVEHYFKAEYIQPESAGESAIDPENNNIRNSTTLILVNEKDNYTSVGSGKALVFSATSSSQHSTGSPHRLANAVYFSLYNPKYADIRVSLRCLAGTASVSSLVFSGNTQVYEDAQYRFLNYSSVVIDGNNSLDFKLTTDATAAEDIIVLLSWGEDCAALIFKSSQYGSESFSENKGEYRLNLNGVLFFTAGIVSVILICAIVYISFRKREGV
ncbi:MAG: winged helix-turn-helix domain-containing protein [Thermoplasmata archaeon]